MALPQTLAHADFFDLFGISEVKFTIGWTQERSKTGGGDTLYADLAPPLWKAEITSVPMPNAEAEGVMALINSRGGGLRTVLLTNPRLPYPSSDPTGSIFGAAVPKVGVITDRAHVAFTGFPANYVLPRGTYFQVIFGTRYYLGQFAEARTATGAGAVAAVEITPPLPASIVLGQAVTVAKPAAKFRITPGSAYIAAQDAINAKIVFSAEQSYSA